MKIGGGYKNAYHVHAAVQRGVNILLNRSGEGGNLGLEPKIADLLHSVLLGLGDHREASFYDLDAYFVQAQGNVQLLIGPEDYSGHLLPIPQGDIAYLDIQ